jgi:hypothetical protein
LFILLALPTLVQTVQYSVRINGVQCAICTSFWPKWRKLHITFWSDVQKKLINVSCLQINAN